MELISTISELRPESRPVSLAIGVFDGVHRGHARILLQAITSAGQDGISLAVTFDRHPNAVVAPEAVPPLICPLSKKLRLLEFMRLNAACVIHFDKAFSRMTAEDFVLRMAQACGKLRSISVGREFVFGWRRGGNVALLQKLGQEYGFAVNPIEEEMWQGKPISSTRVREAVKMGDFSAAMAMLGRPYQICGKVIHGAGLGSKLGFPTANLDVAGLLTPPPGVYAAGLSMGCYRMQAAVNIGFRPTLGQAAAQLQVEAHILNGAGDLYGQELELTILKKIRDEQKFPSVDALKEQIAKDVAQVREIPY